MLDALEVSLEALPNAKLSKSRQIDELTVLGDEQIQAVGLESLGKGMRRFQTLV